MRITRLLSKLALTPIRVIVYAVLVFAVVLGAIAFTVFRDDIDEGTLNSIVGSFARPDGQIAAAVSIDGNTQNQYGLYGERLAVLSPERLVLYDASGNESSSAAIHMENPRLRAAGDKVLVFDRAGTACIVAGKDGVELEINNPDQPIVTARVTEDNWFAVATEQSGYRGVVTVYDNENDIRYYSYLAESGYITEIALSKDGSRLAVGSVRQEKDATISRLTLSRTNSETPDAVIDIPDQLILRAEYMGRDRLCVLLEYEVRFYDMEGETVSSYPLDDRYYLGAEITPEMCVLRTSRQTGDYRGGLTLLDKNGKVIGDIALEETQIDAFSAGGSYAGILQGGALALYNDKAELCFYEENLSEHRNLLVTADGSVLLIAHDKAIWLQ
ncbi:MAG: DUF5711 family protein [Oscillospiraceae bacterium]|jgi:hypothetical protein|nr:DUF5711 family protein [Oscillospiraceae bacterium]